VEKYHMSDPLLAIRELSKSFGGVQALAGLHLEVGCGEICGIMGPNGSGKTVLFDLISGYLKPDTGSVQFGPGNVELVGKPPYLRQRLGIMRTYQQLNLFSTLSVLENVMMGGGIQGYPRGLLPKLQPSQWRKTESMLRDRAREVLTSSFAQRLLPQQQSRPLQLSYANRRRLELARALTGQPLLILLDEPTAGMNPTETLDLKRLIYRLNRSLGITVLVIEHKMFFLEDLASRVIVLSAGVKIADDTVERVRRNPAVLESYLGHSPNS
jgi:ABC-type branched-subunit amino acid transport system ATPase component